MTLVTGFVLGLLAALVLTPAAIRVAWRIGYIDHPDARGLHHHSTALLGGAVVFVSSVVVWLATRAIFPGTFETQPALAFAGAVIALALGLLDDRFGMRPSLKMVGEAIAAGALLAGGHIPDLGLPLALDLVIAILCVIGLMNAVNFLDNQNGMVGGLAAVIFLGFAWHSADRGATALAVAQLALAGACLGFLRYNFPKARIFLGDAGSLFLGYSLAASALLAYQSAPQGWGRLGPVLMLGYPTFDMFFVTVTRLRDGRKVWEGGKDHANHRLASVLPWMKTVPLIWLAGAALCVSGLVVLKLNQPLPALALLGLWLAIFLTAGMRLSSVPIQRSRPAAPSPPLSPLPGTNPTPTTSSSATS